MLSAIAYLPLVGIGAVAFFAFSYKLADANDPRDFDFAEIARQHFVVKGEPQRRKVIARQTAYHGVNLGALAISGLPTFQAPFGPPDM